MKIAFIEVTATTSFGGVQTAVWKLAEATAACGHEVTVFGGISDRPRRNGAVHVRTFHYRPREQVIDLGSRFQRTVERLSFARRARTAFMDGDYDWAVINKPFDFFWPWILPASCRTRFAFLSGGTDFIALDRMLEKRIDVMLSCSHFNAWQLRTRYRRRRPIVIYNGVDAAQFKPARSDVRERLGIAPSTVLLGFAGRLVGWKGLSVALRALALPGPRELPLALLLIGDGPQREELARLALELDLGARVLFQDPVPHEALPRWYAAVDIGVFPSIGDEAFGITIAEAMSCAKPVIGSYIGGIPEVIGNEGSCGRLVPPGDPQALAEAIRSLALDQELRSRMGAAARSRIQSLFSWDDAARRLLQGLGA